jgi:hypothetical protein
MNLKNVEVMEQTKTTNKNRYLVPVLTGVALVAANSANAAIETTEIVSEISGLGTAVAAIGGAILLILVAIKGWKLIRRAM